MAREIRFKRVRCKPIKNPFKKPEWSKKVVFTLLGIFFFLLLIFFFSNVGKGNSGQVILEEQGNLIAEIRAVIEVDNAEHLDSGRKFISDITNEVKELDGIWSEEISDREYVRVTFEEELTSKSDITIYPRVVSGEPRIEIYEIDGNEIIATFDSLTSDEYHKIFLTNLQEIQDTFDLKIVGGSIEIDHLVDPPVQIKDITQGVKK